MATSGLKGAKTASRVLVYTAIASGVVYAGGIVALGTPPTAESSGGEIVRWFSTHVTDVRFYAWSASILALGLAVVLSQVAALLPKPHRYIFLIGAAGWVITEMVQAWIWAGLALHPVGAQAATARVLFDIAQYWGPLVNGSTTAMAGAVAALGFKKPAAIPSWLTWLSVVFFLEQLIETVTVFGTSGFIAPGGAMNIYLGGLLGFAWGYGLIFWASRQLKAAA